MTHYFGICIRFLPNFRHFADIKFLELLFLDFAGINFRENGKLKIVRVNILKWKQAKRIKLYFCRQTSANLMLKIFEGGENIFPNEGIR